MLLKWVLPLLVIIAVAGFALRGKFFGPDSSGDDDSNAVFHAQRL